VETQSIDGAKNFGGKQAFLGGKTICGAKVFGSKRCREEQEDNGEESDEDSEEEDSDNDDDEASPPVWPQKRPKLLLNEDPLGGKVNMQCTIRGKVSAMMQWELKRTVSEDGEEPQLDSAVSTDDKAQLDDDVLNRLKQKYIIMPKEKKDIVDAVLVFLADELCKQKV